MKGKPFYYSQSKRFTVKSCNPFHRWFYSVRKPWYILKLSSEIAIVKYVKTPAHRSHLLNGKSFWKLTGRSYFRIACDQWNDSASCANISQHTYVMCSLLDKCAHWKSKWQNARKLYEKKSTYWRGGKFFSPQNCKSSTVIFLLIERTVS